MNAQKKTQDETAVSGKSTVGKGSKKVTPLSGKSKKVEGKQKSTRKPDEPRFQWWEQFKQYLREVVYELKKVVWPSRKETLGTTSVVLVLVILCAVFLGMVDSVLSQLIEMVFG
ncbi:MAG: preprotein translocase subunit SecE [Syntrophobacteraceae bacterium]